MVTEVRLHEGDLALMTEEWRPAPGFSNYVVSGGGRIRHSREGSACLSGSYDKNGYHRVTLERKTVRVHRLVCEAFHGPQPEGCEVAHLDGNALNNSANNLSWVTHRENVAHQIAHGTLALGLLPGANHPNAKLSEVQVEKIRSTSNQSTRALARLYGVNQSQIVRIKNGTRW